LTNDAMNALLAKLDPKTAKRFEMAQGVYAQMLPSASLEYNWATNGGFPRGSITTIYGNYSSSKTALVLTTIGKLQKMGCTCAFVAVEGYDAGWAAKLGVDNDNLLLIKKKSFGAITDQVRPLLKNGLDFLGWDSISKTMPEQFLDDKGESNNFDGQKQIGAASRSAGVALNDIDYNNERTAVVLISQTRTDMTNSMRPVQKPTNGKVVEFSSNVMVRMQAPPQEAYQIKGNVFIGDKIHEFPIGREVKFEVVKNKMGPPNRASAYKFYYDGDFIGIDNVDELVTMGKRFGVIRASGAWVYYGDDQWNGSTKFVQALKDDEVLFERVKADVEMVTTGEVKDEQLGEVPEAAEGTSESGTW